MRNCMKDERTLPEKILLDLLRISLWHAEPIEGYTNLSEERWMEIYRLSGEQGVRSLALEGVSDLPSTWQPQEELLLTWSVNAAFVEKRQSENSKALMKLSELLQKEKIRLLVLKGKALALYYPNPEQREYGDIDIYLFGQKKKGDHLLQKYGQCIKNMPKHTTFLFEQVLVENHRTFTDEVKQLGIFGKKRKKAFEKIERTLRKVLKEEGECYLEGTTIQVPSATFNFLFLMMHTGTHLGRELVLRHLCDWACFLASNKGRYNEDKIVTILGLLNLKKLCLIMTDVAIQLLGMPRKYAPSFYNEDNRKRLVKRLVDSLLYHYPAADEVKVNSIGCKWQRFYQKQWAYDLFYKEYLPERLCRTVIVWMKERYKKINSQ